MKSAPASLASHKSMKSFIKTCLGGLVLVALCNQSSAFGGTLSSEAATTSSQVPFVKVCGSLKVKPDSLTQFCADAGVQVIHIHWKSWGATLAEGTGTLSINSCDPYCAAGKYYSTPVTVLLTKARSINGSYQFQKVSVKVLAGKKLNLPAGMKSVPGGLSWSN
jgi:hypothetical protein